MDFCYKEKKKSDKSNDGNSKTIDFTLFCFTVYYYSAKKFMFSLHKLSRKYRYLDTNRELYLGFLHVQFVPASSWSTSCVRHDQRLSASLFLIRQCAPTCKLRHLKDLNLTQLIHLRTNEFNSISVLQANDNKKKSDSNTSNNDSDSSSIVSLYFLIIERAFQNDGECIVIRLSTLIDRKEQKKLSSKHWEYVLTRLVHNIKDAMVNDGASDLIILPKYNGRSDESSIDETEQEEEKEGRVNEHSIDAYINERVLINLLSTCTDDECTWNLIIKSPNNNKNNKDWGIVLILVSKRTNSIDNTSNNRTNDRIILIPLLNRSKRSKECEENNIDGRESFSNDNEKCIDYVLILLSKPLNHNSSDDDNISIDTSNNDDGIHNNTSVLPLLLNRISKRKQLLLIRMQEERSNKENCTAIFLSKCTNIDNKKQKSIDYNIKQRY